MANNTIKDIAKMAEVSIATVSRVINGNYPVSMEARERVLKAIKELNYKPNAVARSLKMDSTRTIGILVSDIANPYFMTIAKAIENVVGADRYNIMVCSTEEEEEKEVANLQMLVEKRVDAIVLSSSSKGSKIAEELKMTGVPVILIDRKIEGLDIDLIVDDNKKGSRMLTEYLIGLGHTEIALIAGKQSTSTGRDRLQGYMDAFRNAGITPEESLIYSGNYSEEFGYETANHIFKQGMAVTAVFAANNLITRGVLMAAKDMGKSIPEDFSLVGFGDKELTRLVSPPVTSIVQKPFEMGIKAGELVLDRINGKTGGFEEIIIPPEMFIGESCRRLEHQVK